MRCFASFLRIEKWPWSHNAIEVEKRVKLGRQWKGFEKASPHSFFHAQRSGNMIIIDSSCVVKHTESVKNECIICEPPAIANHAELSTFRLKCVVRSLAQNPIDRPRTQAAAKGSLASRRRDFLVTSIRTS